ncbi:MAG: hypothetical protein KGL39_22575 [Patescibacteria group bacterium]|nr:hypothetical protein [Patescibacteria group bacterium]
MPLFTSGNPFANGVLTTLAGCDYKAADGNAVKIINAAGTWPTLTGTPWLVGYRGNQPIPAPVPVGTLESLVVPQFPNPLLGPIAGTIAVASGANQEVDFDLPALATSVTPCPTATDLYCFAVFCQLANGDIVPLQTGTWNALGVGS